MSNIVTFRVLQKIRNAGFSADMDFTEGSLKSQMRIANKKRAKYVVIVREDKQEVK